MRLAMQAVSAYLACVLCLENYFVMFQTSTVGEGDFTFTLTLGIIPDPNSILGVLYHEVTILCRCKINRSYGSR